METKENIVVLVSRFPYPLEKGDKLRAYYQIRELAKEYHVTLIAISDKAVGRESIEKLTDICASVHIIRINPFTIFWNVLKCFFNKKPFQVGYFYSSIGKSNINSILQESKPKHIYCQLIRCSEYVKNIHEIPKTLDYMDALSKGIERRIEKTQWYNKWLFKEEAKRLKLYERSVFDYFENKTIISDQDRELILHPERSKIHSIPNGIDEKFFIQPEVKKEFDLVFIGNLSYPPNVEAVEYIANQILTKDNELTCLISGATPHPTVVKICKSNPQITLQGWVDDIRESYCRGRIFIAPMMIGTGMQNKLLEAMALGIPCITTSLANNAIKATNGESILVADNSEEYLSSIHELLIDTEMSDRIAVNGQSFVKQHYSWEKTTGELIKLIQRSST